MPQATGVIRTPGIKIIFTENRKIINAQDPDGITDMRKRWGLPVVFGKWRYLLSVRIIDTADITILYCLVTGPKTGREYPSITRAIA